MECKALICGALVLALAGTGFGVPAWHDDEDVSELVASMDESELAGQVLMLGYDGEFPSDEFVDFVQRAAIGGIKVFGWNAGNLRVLSAGISRMQEAASLSSLSVPLLVATDQEGGWVRHIKGETSETPGNLAIGASGIAIDAYQSGLVIGRELWMLGINMNFAPTVDVYVHPDAEVIGPRAFSADPVETAFLAIAFYRGLEEAGVVATAKHFPGHGNTGVDSHGAMPVIEDSLETIWGRDLVPYRMLVAEGLPAIMSGHLSFPAITGDEFPATLSPKFLQEILRDTLGFKGLVITDDLRMFGVLQGGKDIVEVSKLALEAGNDMILISTNLALHKQVHDFLTTEARNDRAFRRTLQGAALRILRIKQRYISDGVAPQADDDQIDNILDPLGRDALFDLACRSITVGGTESIPLSESDMKDRGANLLLVGQHAEFFSQGLDRFPSAESFQFAFGGASESQVSSLLTMANEADRVIYCLGNEPALKLLESLEPIAEKVTVFSVHTPKYLGNARWIRSSIATFASGVDSFRAGFAVLAGDYVPEGSMPIPLETSAE